MEKTNVILDTNLLYESGKNEIKNYKEFELSSNFDSIVSFLETNDLIENYNVWIPEIVFMELEQQRKEKYKVSIDNIKNEFKKLENYDKAEYNLPNINYEKELTKIISEYKKNNKINVLKIPKNEKLFEKILERCVKKQKPFCKGSDKGFKDVILWESILDFTNYNKGKEKYILITNNSEDFVKILEQEFFTKTQKNIHIYYKIKDFQEAILKINEIQSRISLDNSLIESENESGELIDKVNEFLLKTSKQNIEKIKANSVNGKLEIKDIVEIGNKEYNIQVFYKILGYWGNIEQYRAFDVRVVVKENIGIVIQDVIEIPCV